MMRLSRKEWMVCFKAIGSIALMASLLPAEIVAAPEAPKIGDRCTTTQLGETLTVKDVAGQPVLVRCAETNLDPHIEHYIANVGPEGKVIYGGNKNAATRDYSWVAVTIPNISAALGVPANLWPRIEQQGWKIPQDFIPNSRAIKFLPKNDPCRIQGNFGGYGDPSVNGRRGWPSDKRRKPYPRLIDEGWPKSSGTLNLAVALTWPKDVEVLRRDSVYGNSRTVARLALNADGANRPYLRQYTDSGGNTITRLPADLINDRPGMADFDTWLDESQGTFFRYYDLLKTRAHINFLLFDRGNAQSLASWLVEQSYGRLQLTGEVSGPQRGEYSLEETLTGNSIYKQNAVEQRQAYFAFKEWERLSSLREFDMLANYQFGNNDTSWNNQTWDPNNFTGSSRRYQQIFSAKEFRAVFTVSEGKGFTFAPATLSHELGHALALKDTYGNPRVPGRNLKYPNRYAGGVGWMDNESSGTFGWTKYIQRWMHDYEVECIPYTPGSGPYRTGEATSLEYSLWPVQSGLPFFTATAQEHRHMIVIPLSYSLDCPVGQPCIVEDDVTVGGSRPGGYRARYNSKTGMGSSALVIERWDKLGSSSQLTPGIRAYVVNASTTSFHSSNDPGGTAQLASWERMSNRHSQRAYCQNNETSRAAYITSLRSETGSSISQYVTSQDRCPSVNMSQADQLVDQSILDNANEWIAFSWAGPTDNSATAQSTVWTVIVTALDAAPSGSAPHGGRIQRVKVTFSGG